MYKKGSIKKMNNLKNLGLFIFFLLFPFLQLFNIGASILGLTGLLFLPYFKDIFKNLKNKDKTLLKLFFVYGICLLLINTFHQNPIKEFEYGAKFLLIIPVFLLFQKLPIKPIHFFILIMCSTIINAIVGYYNYIHYDWASRATVKGLNTIHYGSIMQFFAFTNIIGLHLVKQLNNKIHKILYILLGIVGFCMGIYSSMLSCSRGVFIAIPVQLLLVSIFYFKYHKLATIITSILIAITMYYTVPTGCMSRIDSTTTAINSYKKGDAKTNTGVRLDMYKFALSLAKEKPILGVSSKEIKIKQDKIPHISYLLHFHNHYFHNLAHYGIVGLVLLLLVYIFSFLSFWDRFKSSNENIKSLGTVGILLLCSYSIYSLTDVMFNKNIGLLIFAILISMLCSLE